MRWIRAAGGRGLAGLLDGLYRRGHRRQRAPSPTAELSINPAAGALTVTFVAKSSGFPSPVVSYAWNFGDGHTATTSIPTVTHSYASASTFRRLGHRKRRQPRLGERVRHPEAHEMHAREPVLHRVAEWRQRRQPAQGARADRPVDAGGGKPLRGTVPGGELRTLKSRQRPRLPTPASSGA